MSDQIQFKGGAKALLSAFDGTKLFVTGNGATVSIQLGDALKKLAHKPHAYMGAVKAALKCDELTSPAECADKLEKLRGHVEACLDDDGDPDEMMVDGAALGDYTRPLKSLVDAQPGDTWAEVFDAVQALIQAAIEQHEVRDHSGAEPQMSDRPAVSAAPPVTQTPAGASPAPATPNATEPPMPTPATPAPDTAVKMTELEAKLNEFSLQMTAVNGKLAEQAGVIAAKDAEIATLTADLKKRDADRAVARVEEAYESYKTKYNLTDGHKPQMAMYLAAKPEEFEKLYPRVPGSLQHLLHDLTGGRPPGASGSVPGPTVKPPSLGELAIKLAQDRKIELADAQCIVFASAQKALAQAAAA